MCRVTDAPMVIDSLSRRPNQQQIGRALAVVHVRETVKGRNAAISAYSAIFLAKLPLAGQK